MPERIAASNGSESEAGRLSPSSLGFPPPQKLRIELFLHRPQKLGRYSHYIGNLVLSRPVCGFPLVTK